MRTQLDQQVRIVSLHNLQGMCKYLTHDDAHYLAGINIENTVSRVCVWLAGSISEASFIAFLGWPDDNGLMEPVVVLDPTAIIDSFGSLLNFVPLFECPALWGDELTETWHDRNDCDNLRTDREELFKGMVDAFKDEIYRDTL